MGSATPATLQFVAAMSILGLMAGGAFIGSMIGLFIGWGITSADDYANSYSLKSGQILMRAVVNESIASTAWNILNRVAMEARTLHASAHPI